VISTLTLTSAENNVAKLIAVGRYHDELIKENGKWRIKNKTLYADTPF
jgi:hypothetical protein